MNKGARPVGVHDPTTAEGLEPNLSRTAVESQLERILASQIFAHSENLSRFLRFIVEAPDHPGFTDTHL